MYSKDTLKSIGLKIRNIYTSCPNGFTVDHIVPVSMFNLMNENELKACWDVNNLRYLEGTLNMKRKNKMTKDEIEFMWSNFPEIISQASRLKTLSTIA